MPQSEGMLKPEPADRQSKSDFPTPILVVVLFVLGLISVCLGSLALGASLAQPKERVIGTAIAGAIALFVGLVWFGLAQLMVYLRDIRGYMKILAGQSKEGSA